MDHHGGAEGAEDMVINELTEKIIGAAIEVHKALGPGLLESGLRWLFSARTFDCRYRL